MLRSLIATLGLAGSFTGLVSARPLNAPLLDVYDYIIVGGGPSGLTVANRLTEDPDINVLVLEAGFPDHYEALIQIPVHAGGSIISAYNWADMTVPQTSLDGRPRNLPQGYALGGGTIINAMLWNRGDIGDYDDWVELGNEGWGWDDLLPYFEKSESFSADYSPENAEYFGLGNDASVHGTDGPLENVGFPRYFYNVSHQWFEGINALGVPTVPDPATGDEKGAMFLPYDTNTLNQTRADARRTYYEPFAQRENLYVSTRQRVTRLLFEGGCAEPNEDGARAVGVEFAPNAGDPRQTVAARREVILAAGSIRSPQLLELAGIGSRSALRAGGIQERIVLPGVGNNLQDHLLVRTFNTFNNPDFIYPNFLQNQTNNATAEAQYFADRTGPWTFGPDDGNAFLSLPQFSERAQQIRDEYDAQSSDEHLAEGLDDTVVAGYNAMKPLISASLTNNRRGAIELLQSNGGVFESSNMRPMSRGSVHITSDDSFADPDIDFRYGSNPLDLDIIVDGMSFIKRVLNTPDMQILEPALGTQLQPDDNAGLLDVVRREAATEFHPTGTCAMMPRNRGGVVDPTLLVYGTQNIRVIDASIEPLVPASHMMAPIYAVAEKAADVIKAAAINSPSPTDPDLPLDRAVCTSAPAPGAEKKKKRAATSVLDKRAPSRPVPRGPSYRETQTPPRPDASILKNLILVAGQYPNPEWQERGLPDSDLVEGLPKAASVGKPVGRALRWAERQVGELAGDVRGIVDGLLGGEGEGEENPPGYQQAPPGYEDAPPKTGGRSKRARRM